MLLFAALNFSVVGLNFDFLTLNVLGFTVYSIYNVGLFWIPSVIKEYQEENQTLILPGRLAFFRTHLNNI